MDPVHLVALVLVGLPLATFGLVSAGVGLLTLFACWWGRNDPRDPVQEQHHAARRASLLTRGLWLAIEGFWQTLSFVLQGWHVVRRWRPPPLPRAPGASPVILVAGYLENSGQMYVLGARLRRAGFLVVHRDLPSTLHSIERNARWLGDEVRAILEATGGERAAIVAHSMGGVIGRTLVHLDPCAPVTTVVSIASPHRGTRMGHLGLGPSARDMRPGSAHCARFPSPRTSPCQVPVHSLVGFQEDIVSPYWSSLLDGEGDNVVLDVPAGHVAPLFLPSVARQVVAWLEAAGTRRLIRSASADAAAVAA